MTITSFEATYLTPTRPHKCGYSITLLGASKARRHITAAVARHHARLPRPRPRRRDGVASASLRDLASSFPRGGLRRPEKTGGVTLILAKRWCPLMSLRRPMMR